MVIRTEEARQESECIGLLLQWDGLEAARKWVTRTAQIYQTAIADPHNHGSDPAYRPLFERAIKEMREWLDSRALADR